MVYNIKKNNGLRIIQDVVNGYEISVRNIFCFNNFTTKLLLSAVYSLTIHIAAYATYF